MSFCDQVNTMLREKAEYQRKRRHGPLFSTDAEVQQLAILNAYLNLLPSDRALKKARLVNRAWIVQMERNVA